MKNESFDKYMIDGKLTKLGEQTLVNLVKDVEDIKSSYKLVSLFALFGFCGVISLFLVHALGG